MDRQRDAEKTGRTGQGGDKGGKDKKKGDKKDFLGPFDPDMQPEDFDDGQQFAGETEEEARKRREEGGKSKRPEEIQVQKGGIPRTQRAGVQTEDNGKQARGGLAI
jgi:hypothetical protein